jgi:acyl-CoA thioesterase I
MMKKMSAATRCSDFSLGLRWLQLVGRFFLLNLAAWVFLSPVHAGAKTNEFTATATSGALQPKPRSLKLLVLGDSLSAEYGLPRGKGWVALLETKLHQENLEFSLVNASISGETTAGGKSRLAALLTEHRPSHVIVELGANDALRGFALSATQKNLSEMLARIKTHQAQTLLLGMQVPPNYGADYSRQFAAVFAQVSQEQGAKLLPFFLKNVADRPDAADWFQSDRIHPNERAHPILLANVWPLLAPMLKVNAKPHSNANPNPSTAPMKATP